jgi:acyl-CoA thioesterase
MSLHAPNRFDRDTRVTPHADGHFEADIDTGWWVIRGPNGGYVAAIALRAACEAVQDETRTPRSLTVHYLSPPVEGPASVETRIERTGRSLSTVTARMSQGDRLRAIAIAALSTPRESHSFYHAEMPDVPPADSLEPLPPSIPLHDRYEYRFVPDMRPNIGAERAITAAWIRLSEPHALDHALLAAYADALPPAIFARAHNVGEFGALPTVDLTVHFRVDPKQAELGPDDFCLAVFHSRLAHGGYIEEDGEIWSPGGQLLAQSRQLAVILGA